MSFYKGVTICVKYRSITEAYSLMHVLKPFLFGERGFFILVLKTFFKEKNKCRKTVLVGFCS